MVLASDNFDLRIDMRGRALVEAHRGGDPDAFPTIVRDHYRVLLTQAERRLGNRAEAEDAVQEVFERAFRAIDRFGGEYRLSAWLSLITSNVCANHGARRAGEKRLAEALGFRALPAADDPSDSISDPTVLAAVRSAINALPNRQRDTFVLHEVNGLSYPQVAGQLGISEANARARVHRAKATLRHNLQGVRNALGGFIALPIAARGLAHRLSPSRGLAGRTGAATTASNALPTPALAGTDALPSTAPSLTVSVKTAHSFAGLQQTGGQLMSQAASTPLGQLAIAAAPSAPRGSLLVALAASVAAVTTATFAAPGVATHPAAAAPRAVVAPASSGQPTPTSAPTPPPPASAANAATAVPAPAASVSSTTSNQPALAAVTPAATPPTPGWIDTATSASVTVGSGSSGTTVSIGAGGSSTAPASPSTGGNSAPGSAAVAGSGACPWLSNFSGASPGQVFPTDPLSGSITQVLGTSSVDLTNTSTNPMVTTTALLTSTASSATSTQVEILAGACLPPATGALVVDMTGHDGNEVQLRGSLVATTGDVSAAGYLFRGTVVPLTDATSTGSTSATAPSTGLPWGLAANFVAQLLIRQPANTAELSLAFLTTPTLAADQTTCTSNCTPSPSDPASGSGSQTSSTYGSAPTSPSPGSTPSSTGPDGSANGSTPNGTSAPGTTAGSGPGPSASADDQTTSTPPADSASAHSSPAGSSPTDTSAAYTSPPATPAAL